MALFTVAVMILIKPFHLIYTLQSQAQNQFPELRNVRYDFNKRQLIRTDSNMPVDWEKFQLARSAGVGTKARAGEATARRGAFIQSLVSSESGERPGILEHVLSRADSLIKNGNAINDKRWFDNTRFNFANGRFENGSGADITSSEYAEHSKRAREKGFGIGEATIKRAILTKQYLSDKDERGRRRFVEFLDSLVSGHVPDSIRGIAYTAGT